MVDHNGQLYIYYSYFPQNHNSSDNSSSGGIYLATLPEDRFMGIRSSPGSVGTWTTSAHHVSDDPGHLIINAPGGRLAPRGSARCYDPDGRWPVSRCLMRRRCSPGDYLEAIAGWNGGDTFNSLAGRTVALRFTMDNATVYGFHFEPVPEPSAIVLLVTGLIGLLVYAWRKRH